MTITMASSVLKLATLCAVLFSSAAQYKPTWESLDSRPLPAWYDEVKLGIFIHWGVFSVPSFRSEWFWWDWQGAKDKDVIDYMKTNFKPDFTYPDFGPQFTAEFFSPEEWADIFNASGAGYIVFVSKHHEGYTNWPSKYSWNWNSMDVGPNRDIVGELADAIKSKTNLHFGLYHSLFEWFNPLYVQDKANNFTTQDFVNTKTLPELYELVNTYKPDIVWSDGDWDAKDTYWKSRDFLAWLYNSSPVKDTVVTNDRWGNGVMCHHGGFFTCSDRYNPGVLQKRKWENAMTLDKQSWGFRRTAQLSDYLTMEELLATFASTVSCGGNMLVNVGPTHSGMIDPIFEERLRQLGSWLHVNGEAIYKSRPWSHQNDTKTPGIWYTKGTTADGGYNVYAIVLEIKGEPLFLGAPQPSPQTTVSMLGYPGNFHWETGLDGIIVSIPPISVNDRPCQWAWVLKLTNLLN
ncbi:alpha-L-fucosidase-like [Babylonia areolata]|uniref:alpha-L-fucosidase-like n=1 Tax=Babylonia areolata TaxID=304850 RepID=UPI003FD2DAB9